jgi:hypothetical protein
MMGRKCPLAYSEHQNRETEMNLTNLERQGLQGIVKSDFQDGNPPVDNPVWTFSANPFKSKRTFSGVMSSLVQKGLAGSQDDGPEHVVWITEAGLAALNSPAA